LAQVSPVLGAYPRVGEYSTFGSVLGRVVEKRSATLSSSAEASDERGAAKKHKNMNERSSASDNAHRESRARGG